MTGCPGYVSVKVNIWPTPHKQKPLVNYDALVSCPPTFYLAFSLSHHVADFKRSTLEDCILECVLDDGKNVHRLLLRPVFEQRHAFETPQQSTKKDQVTEEHPYNNDDGALNHREDFDLPTFGVAVLLSTSITLTVVWLFCELFRLMNARPRGRRHRGRSSPNPEGSVVPLTSLSVLSRRRLTDAALRMLTSACMILRLIYAFTFTFSVFTTVVSVVLRHRVDYKVTANSTPRSQPVTDVEEKSTTSSRLQLISCLSRTNIQLTRSEELCSRRVAAVSDVVASSLSSTRTAAVQWAEQATKRVLDDINVGLTRQRRYAQTTSLNNWLLFPRALYNKTTETGNLLTPPIVASFKAEGSFWNFIQVTPLEIDLSLWTANIHER